MYGSMPASLAVQPRVARAVRAGQARRRRAAAGCRSLRRRARCASSKRGRFSGCAIVPTSWRAASRGSCVSVSSVITYRTPARPAMSADDAREALAARRRAAARSGPPACRACARSPSRRARAAFQRRGAVEQEEDVAAGPRRAVLLVERLDALLAPGRSSASSSGRVSSLRVGEIGQQARSAGGRRGWPRKRTSSASTRSSTSCALREHRRHHDQRAAIPAGCPRRKSMRGSSCGATSSVASQFTSATASWLAPSNDEDAAQQRAASRARRWRAPARNRPAGERRPSPARSAPR